MKAASHNPAPTPASAPPFMSPAAHMHETRLAGARPGASHGLAWDPIRTAVDCWTWYSRLGDIWWTRAAGGTAIAAASRDRFDALVAFARAVPFLPGGLSRTPGRKARARRVPIARLAAVRAALQGHGA
jgi:hypothetical protein